MCNSQFKTFVALQQHFRQSHSVLAVDQEGRGDKRKKQKDDVDDDAKKNKTRDVELIIVLCATTIFNPVGNYMSTELISMGGHPTCNLYLGRGVTQGHPG